MRAASKRWLTKAIFALVIAESAVSLTSFLTRCALGIGSKIENGHYFVYLAGHHVETSAFYYDFSRRLYLLALLGMIPVLGLSLCMSAFKSWFADDTRDASKPSDRKSLRGCFAEPLPAVAVSTEITETTDRGVSDGFKLDDRAWAVCGRHIHLVEDEASVPARRFVPNQIEQERRATVMLSFHSADRL